MSSYTRGFEYGVIHQLSEGPGDLKSLLEKDMGAKKLSIDEYLELGCIYVNQARTQQNLTLKKGDYIRWHTQPRRYSIQDLDLEKRILFENENLILFNKPAGVPCHPTVDNLKENLTSLFSLHRGSEILITHRLDLPTQGLLVLAKNKKTQSVINQLFQNRQIEKIYTAWTRRWSPEQSLLTHWMKPSPRAPKHVFSEPFEDGIECLLRIFSSKELQISNRQLLNLEISRHQIQLLTGRTHQIRAQLSFEKYPVIGDVDYGAESLNTNLDRLQIALWSSRISIPENPLFPNLQFEIQDSVSDLFASVN